jgi:hypothetical protein
MDSNPLMIQYDFEDSMLVILDLQLREILHHQVQLILMLHLFSIVVQANYHQYQ